MKYEVLIIIVVFDEKCSYIKVCTLLLDVAVESSSAASSSPLYAVQFIDGTNSVVLHHFRRRVLAVLLHTMNIIVDQEPSSPWN